MLMAMVHAAATGRLPAMRRVALHLNSNSQSGLDVECLVGDAFTTEEYQAVPTIAPARPHKYWRVYVGLETNWTPPEDVQDAWKKSAGEGCQSRRYRIRRRRGHFDRH